MYTLTRVLGLENGDWRRMGYWWHFQFYLLPIIIINVSFAGTKIKIKPSQANNFCFPFKCSRSRSPSLFGRLFLSFATKRQQDHWQKLTATTMERRKRQQATSGKRGGEIERNALRVDVYIDCWQFRELQQTNTTGLKGTPKARADLAGERGGRGVGGDSHGGHT